MSALAIFLYGVFVIALVGTALGLIVWGIVVDRRSRPEEEGLGTGGEGVQPGVEASTSAPGA